jgi:hypothetical protein
MLTEHRGTHMTPADKAKALVHQFEMESMALHQIQREWLEREITKLLAAGTAVAWMNSEHIDGYLAGKKDGVAWASPQESEFYNVALYTSI